MHVAFTLFRYRHGAPLSRHLASTATHCYQRGAQVSIYCRDWQGPRPPWATVHVLPAGGWRAGRRNRAFAHALEERLRKQRPDRLVGLDPMPGLDIFLATSGCYYTRTREHRSSLAMLDGRYRQTLQHEAATLAPEGAPRILVRSQADLEDFRDAYRTPAERFAVLPAGVDPAFVLPEDWRRHRHAVREELGVVPSRQVVLFIGDDFSRQGLSRSLRGLAALPMQERRQIILVVVGKDHSAPFRRLAVFADLGDHTRFLKSWEEMPSLLWAADLLLHPAHRRLDGTLLLEAMVAGLPVVTTEVCTYSQVIREQEMGEVLAADYRLEDLPPAISRTLFGGTRAACRERGQSFAQSAEIFGYHAAAADQILRG